jgi:molybdenum cofactor cytidylyltransferase
MLAPLSAIMQATERSPCVLLLAAGFSRRFGADKTLWPLADGTPLAAACVRRIQTITPHLCVVLRPEQQQLAALLAPQAVRMIVTSDAERGMGASLAAGVAATADAAGWLIALADMPYIQPQSYQQLLQRLSAGPDDLICLPDYQGQRGHPVGFGRYWRAELLALDGDSGARGLLVRHAAQVERLACSDPGVLADIDRPQDFAQG